jgi:hypothetical protein
MLRIPLVVAVLALAGGDRYADRPRHPLAPSLPQLTEKENAKLEAIVDHFIKLEIGGLPKSQEKEAKDAIYRLGPEAIFALVDGFNRAARVESSCATVTIGKKIETIIRQSNDIELITYIRENLGVGLDKTGKRPLPVTNSLRNVQTVCLLRKGEILRKGLSVTPLAKIQAVTSMSLDELEKATSRERGEMLRKVLAEIGRRDNARSLAILSKVASAGDPEGRNLAKVVLAKYAEKQSPTALKTLLGHDSAPVRAAAARAVGSQKLRYGDELIALLADDDYDVQRAAHAALVQIAGGRDLGPQPGAGRAERTAAAQKWRQWWQGQ